MIVDTGGNQAVRMIVPPLARRRTIDRNLGAFFKSHKVAAFNRAISEFCRFYRVNRPKIEWYEYLDWGKTAGKTYENGRIHLVHPENWKRGRIYNSERMWVQIVYHEMGHYLFWADAERKADSFTRRMVLGLRRPPADASRRAASRRAIAGGRQASAVRARSRIKITRRVSARRRRS